MKELDGVVCVLVLTDDMVVTIGIVLESDVVGVGVDVGVGDRVAVLVAVFDPGCEVACEVVFFVWLVEV
jgi:hypothetical protein